MKKVMKTTIKVTKEIKEVERTARELGLRISFRSLPKARQNFDKYKGIVEDGKILRYAGHRDVKTFGDIELLKGTHHMLFARFLYFFRNRKTEELQKRKLEVEREITEIAAKVKDAKKALEASNRLIIKRNAIQEVLKLREEELKRREVMY